MKDLFHFFIFPFVKDRGDEGVEMIFFPLYFLVLFQSFFIYIKRWNDIP